MANDRNYTVRKSGDNYVLYFRGKRSEGPPLATRATANKFARLMEGEYMARMRKCHA